MGAICSIDTNKVAPGARLDYWNDAVSEIFTGILIDSDSERFGAQLLHVKLGRIGFMRARSSQATVRRWSGSGGVKSHPESLVLHLQNAGSCVNRQGGREAALGTGDFTLCDSSMPYAIDLSAGNDMLVVDLPLDLVAERLPVAFERILEPVSGACPPVRMLSTFLLTLWQECDCEAEGESWLDGLEDALLDLLGLALSASYRDTPSVNTSRGLRQQLMACIQQELGDPNLSTKTLAAKTGVSMRTVQSTFARMGTTPTAFVLERRLARAAEWLRTRPRTRITDIAYETGFNDSAYFARCFRQRYGQCPREYRVS